MSRDQERIVCAALRIEDGLYVCGVRHGDDIMRAQYRAMGYSHTHGMEQGFLTSKRRFVDRTEGLRIALDANQVIEKSGNPTSTELYSEDIY